MGVGIRLSIVMLSTKFNGNDVQDGLWESYQETLDNSAEWEDFVINNAVNYLEDIIAYGFGS